MTSPGKSYGASDAQDGRNTDEPVVVRDRRKVDPETGERREESVIEEVPEVSTGAAGPSAGESTLEETAVQSDTEKQLAERTADLQRLQADYANYRKRVERDRDSVIAGAKADVVSDLLPVLDDLERAEAHGDLTGAFKSVSDKLVDGLRRAGLEGFGSEGDVFDPSVHEAVQHDTSSEVDGPTVTTVLRRGYRLSEKVLRAALVGVTDHEPSMAVPEEPVEAPVEGELPVEAQQPFDEQPVDGSSQ